ncbi:MAG: exosortase A [Propionivibrio sp.]|nr:exosortase A [Propionivibrio sp.]
MALPALVVALLAILVLYRETAMAMVEIWARSDTFMHGFVVPPITLWLIWRIRKSIALLTPRPSVWVILGLLATGFVWLLGELATVGVVSQFAFTTMLVLAVPAVLGFQVARRITFPLAFLYFAVPFGEFALPHLMEWTANFTILGLRLSGIPVYREGLHFVIPSGSWSVVEACSGVRYIIASLTVGTLFAYLSYHSLRRRLIFIGVAFIVPVIANWVRAYMIVMIGHLSGNKLAVGVDHLIYGWAFFGIVIISMFWIGSHWREDELPAPAPPLLNINSAVGGGNSSPLVLAFAVIVMAAIWPLAQWQIERNLPPQVTQLEALGPITGWPTSPEKLSDWSPSFKNPSATLQSAFSSDGRAVGLYLGYYRNQDDSHKMVTSVNVLVKSGDPVWARINGGVRQITLNQQSISVRTAELRSADSSRLVVWQWYWVNGHLTASDFRAKAYTAWSRITGQGDDSAVIIVYAPKEQAGGGEAALEAFIHVAWPEIESVLRRTREKR